MFEIKSDDYAEMRLEYTDYLRLRNLNDEWIQKYLSDFDILVVNKDQKGIENLMNQINVRLV